MTMIKSVIVFGASGGIGSSFINLAQKHNVQTYNFVGSKQSDSCETGMTSNSFELDLSKQIVSECLNIPNADGLLYVAGKYHFGEHVFDYQVDELYEQINVNICSLFLIFRKMCLREDRNLKRIVVVVSNIPPTIFTLYHAVKRMQESFLYLIRDSLKQQNIGLSLIKTGWVNTRMMRAYEEKYSIRVKKYLTPDFVAEECLRMFSSTLAFHEICL